MDDPASIFAFLLFAQFSETVETPGLIGIISGILLVLALVLANGFFVASEFAFVALRRTRIESLAAEGNAAAIRLLGILNNLNAYISATQLGITLSSLGLGWIGEPFVASVLDVLLLRLAEFSELPILASTAVLHSISFIIAFALITSLHIVFGELAPKTAALELAERVSFFVAVPMQLFYKVFYYPIRLLDWAGTTTARVFGLRPSAEHGAGYSEEEIRQLVSASHKKGLLKEEESRLIDKVFEFSDTTVREAMIPRTEVVAISEDLSFEEIVETFHRHGYSRLPVYGESLDDIRGVIHSKDVLAFVFHPEGFDLKEILQKPIYVVDTAQLEDVLRRMQKEKFHFGFVVDEHGGIEGIITLEDLLEEIVGEISDEHDEEVNEQVNELPDGSYLLEGGLAVRDLNRRLGLNLPVSESYTTVAGFLMSLSGEILAEGDSVPFNGHIFHIQQAAKRRILKIRMEKTENSRS